MSSIVVGVLRGGPSLEHEVSLKTGKSVLDNLPSGYIGKDIFIDKNTNWHLERKSTEPEKVFRQVDVVLNALHGNYGEDGKVQQLMDSFNVPYTGSGAMASAIGMNKILAKEVFKNAGLKIARGAIAERGGIVGDSARKIFSTMSPPWVVKPSSSGSSVGVSLAKNFIELETTMESAFELGDKILVEEYISGREATCGVIDNFRNQAVYSLPVIEIIPQSGNNFFDYSAKYCGQTRELCPALSFDLPTKKKIEEMARIAHQAIGARHYSRSDFIVSKKDIYILEINTLPGLTNESLMPKAINAVGSSYKELLNHLISLALNK